MSPDEFEKYVEMPLYKRLKKYVDNDHIYQTINNTYYHVAAVDILDAIEALNNGKKQA